MGLLTSKHLAENFIFLLFVVSSASTGKSSCYRGVKAWFVTLPLNKDIAGLDWATFHSLIQILIKNPRTGWKAQEKNSFLMSQYSCIWPAGVAKSEISEQVKVSPGSLQPLLRNLKTNPNPTKCHKEITKETSSPNSCVCGWWAVCCFVQVQM